MRHGLAPIFRWGIRSSPAPSSLSPSNEDFPEGGESGASARQATRLKSGVNGTEPRTNPMFTHAKQIDELPCVRRPILEEGAS
jgi:hypothetical protein